MHTLPGIDVLLQSGQPHAPGRIGLVCNAAVCTRALTPVREALLRAGYQIVALFSPEHGLQAAAADGQPVNHSTDALTGLPVYSLYGPGTRPDPEVLRSIDTFLFDLPDIGVRFYTYIWTLSHLMEACAEHGIPMWVLDRPNPLGGRFDTCEGPMLHPACSSFIGRWNLPIRHGLTMGELALMWQMERQLDFPLTIIPVRHWERTQLLPETGLPFVPGSPGIPAWESVLSYPMLCFLEALNVSEGRGTPWPFRVCGSPWMNGPALANAFNALENPGIQARAVTFRPLESTYAGEWCQGIMVHVTDPHRYRPVAAGLQLLALLHLLFPEHLQERPYPTWANPEGWRHLDLLSGQPEVARLLWQAPQELLAQAQNLTGASDWQAHWQAFRQY
jgi:uncharacterized protein YbbC (DUF1343 family)